jgi:uncharacterized protein (DUF488 family)
MPENSRTIYTIGHSTRTIEAFVAMLQSFEVKMLADIRASPGSRRFPHFNKGLLEGYLALAGIEYVHLPGLGNNRKPLPESKNTHWKNEAMRGFADYMETSSFRKAADQLEVLAKKQVTAYMCAEASWIDCHRYLVSDHFISKEWHVMHISEAGKKIEHIVSSQAKEEQGTLF